MKPIDEFREEYGEPKDFISSASALESLKEAGLPKVVFEYWKRFGFSKFLDGYFQIANPLTYQGVIEKWVAESRFSSADDYFSITIDAFGRVQCWGARTGHVFDLDPPNHAVYDRERRLDVDIQEHGSNFLEQMFFNILPEDVRPEADDFYAQLFFLAKDQLGELGPNQIYAPVPAIPLGGQMRIEDLQIVDAPSYLAMVAEIAQPRVMTMKDLTRLAFGDGADESLANLMKS